MSIFSCELTGSEYSLSKREIGFYTKRELDLPSRTEIERLRSVLSLVPLPMFGMGEVPPIEKRYYTTAYRTLAQESEIFPEIQSEFSVDSFSTFQKLFLKFFGSVSLRDQVVNYGSPLLYGSTDIENSFDCNFCTDCCNCYQVLLSSNCENVFYSRYANNCRDSYFLENCNNCKNCLFCSNIHDEEYLVFNKKVDAESYYRILEELALDNPVRLEQAFERFENFLGNQPFFETFGEGGFKRGFPLEDRTNGVSFFSKDCRNCSSLFGCDGLEKSYSCFGCSTGFTNCHNSSLLFGSGDELYRSISCFGKNKNLELCIGCEDSFDLFCCYGLKNKSFCIFNKQFSKREYFRILNTIKKIFRTDGFSVGLLFDQAKLFPYNHSLADIIFPINKVQAEMMGYLWDASKDTIKIPDTEEDELICTITGLPFRIGDAESEFLMRNKIAAPMRSPGQRFRDRLSKLSLTSKNETQCHVTGKELTNWQQEKRASLSEKAYKIIDKERQSNGK